MDFMRNENEMTAATRNPRVTAPAGNVGLDADGRLFENRPCRRCGYNLRGLSADGACSECGTAVRLSRVYQLDCCDPDWVGQLESGANLIRKALTWSIPVGLVGFPVTAVANFPAVLITCVALLIPIAAVGLIGVWRLTCREPNIPRELAETQTRFMAKWGLLGAAVLYVAGLVLRLTSSANATIALHLAGAASLFGMCGLLRLLATLSQRYPDPHKAKRARQTMVGFSLLCTIVLADSVIRTWSTGGSGILFDKIAFQAFVGTPGATLFFVFLSASDIGGLIQGEAKRARQNRTERAFATGQ
jgi:hypothetical protein